MNIMDDLPADLTKVKQSVHHHRIVILSIVALLILLTIAVVFLLRSAVSPNLRGTTPATQSQIKQEVEVSLSSDYQNPFDKNSQYVNPFLETKNPFDLLTK